VLNDSATVYVPQTSFQKIDSPVAVPQDASLTPYTGSTKPDSAGYSVFHTDKGIGNLGPGEYLVNGSNQIQYKLETNFSPDLKAEVSKLGQQESVRGPQHASDTTLYRVWQKTDDQGGPAGRYLVKNDGTPVYLMDPGINGVHRIRPDGSSVAKFDAPKATLMSYIIKGILNRQLPWGLVILGVMIAITLEMSGIPSLAFAVGVYLPLSSSSPIFVGGIIRWLVDSNIRKKLRHKNLTEEQLVAEGDKSHGVLMSSGYIAGAAIAGIVIAIMQGVLTNKSARIEAWATANNPFFHGPYADVLALIPFAILTGLLLLVGYGKVLASRPSRT
jgi:hypothetical protein